MVGRYDFEIDKGTDWEMIFQMIPSYDGEVIDLTGATILMQFRDCIDCELITQADADIDTATNTVKVSLSHDKTALIMNNTKYDIDIIFANGKRKPLLTGNVTLREKINKF